MSRVLPDPSTLFGERVAQRLREEPILWLTTIGADGTPQPNPIWFLWVGGDSIMMYSKADAYRLAHIKRNPKVALHFNADSSGNDIIVFTGEAHISPDEPSPDKVAAYTEKYRDSIAGSFQTPENFARLYPTPVRITLTKVRGF
ncbi:MAG: TIGR03667 family PPOX class F420-dependent oxidoreductase [Ktedonobacterales bacterium]